jgi:hypothetical protein
MALKEALDLVCAFAGQERADGIDDAPTGLDELRGNIEQALLDGNEAIQPLGRQPPTPLRIAAPGSAPGAGRVDETQVGVGLPVGEFRQLFRRV